MTAAAAAGGGVGVGGVLTKASGIGTVAYVAEMGFDFIGRSVVDKAFAEAFQGLDKVAAGENYTKWDRPPEKILNMIAMKYREELEAAGVEFNPTTVKIANGETVVRDQVDFTGPQGIENARRLAEIIQEKIPPLKETVDGHLIKYGDNAHMPGFTDKIATLFKGDDSEFMQSLDKYSNGMINLAHTQGELVGTIDAMQKIQLETPAKDYTIADLELSRKGKAAEKTGGLTGLRDMLSNLGTGSIIGTLVGLASTMILGPAGIALAVAGAGLGYMFDKSRKENPTTPDAPEKTPHTPTHKPVEFAADEPTMEIETPNVPLNMQAPPSKGRTV